MRSDFALLLSEAKGELRFYKDEVLKDMLQLGRIESARAAVPPDNNAQGLYPYGSALTRPVTIPFRNRLAHAHCRGRLVVDPSRSARTDLHSTRCFLKSGVTGGC